jgi:energy-coupling factor transporter ATP-binding protein EcfA2
MTKNFFVQKVIVKNFGCLKDVAFELTPFHVLIGPNDSGKSTILRALATIYQGLSGKYIEKFPRFGWENPIPDLSIEIHFSNEIICGLDKRENDIQLYFKNEKNSTLLQHGDFWGGPTKIPEPFRSAFSKDILRGVRLVKLDPKILTKPGGLIPENRESLKVDANQPLASLYDTILNQEPEAFLAITKKVRELFPTVDKILLRNVSESYKEISIRLKSGETVPIQFVSDGLLYYLAFSAMLYYDPCDLLLIEEPENGLHPARIANVINLMRQLGETTQIIFTTHSPLVVNEFQPEEVSLVIRDPDKGSAITRIQATHNFAERARVYSLGELWVSYANGRDEKDLMVGEGGGQ